MSSVVIYDYDKDYIKNNLTIEDIVNILTEWHGEPRIINENLVISKTICHNSGAELGNASHKLYYYANTALFHCFTACGDSVDIFSLAQKVLTLQEGKPCDLPRAIDYVARYFGFAPIDKTNQEQMENLEDWRILNNYDRIKDINPVTQEIELKIYDDKILKNLPRPMLTPWISENICQSAMDLRGICYDPKNCGIVIPHRDVNGNLIGIRERSLVEEDIKERGKYRPAYLGGQLYTHPLSYNLYNLNWSKDNIKKIKKAIVFESEKSCLQYASMFGQENDISVACCGSSLLKYQMHLLMKEGAEEVIIAFDHDFKTLADENVKKIIKNLKNIHKNYGNFIKISFIWDKNNITAFKSSPTDNGKEIFLKLYKTRISLY